MKILKLAADYLNSEEVILIAYKSGDPIVASSAEKSKFAGKIESYFSDGGSFELMEEKLADILKCEVKVIPIRTNIDKSSLLLINPRKKKEPVRELISLLADILNDTGSNNTTEIEETLENVDLIIYSTPPDKFEFNLLSSSVKKLFGYDAESVRDSKITLFRRIFKEDYPKFRKFVKNLSEGNSCTIEYRITDNFGSPRFIRHSGIPIIKNGKIVRVVGSIIDLTAESNLRDELKSSEERFRLLIETADDLIFTLDKAGNFLMVNHNGALALGFGLSEMLGRHFLEFVKEESKPDVAVAFQKILNTSEAVKFEARLLDNFGKEMIFDIVARSVKGENGVEGMLAIGRDFTKRRKDELKLKELNNKLIEANRLVSIERDRAKEQITVLEEIDKLKNDFISNVSHELRTPLASIVGFAEAISSDPEMPRDMINEFNEIIFTEGRRLAKLINDILDFSKLDIEGKALEKSDFNLLDLLRDLVKNNLEAAESKGVIFTSEIPEAMVPIYADKERISNALGHILSNAVKFTDKDGRVTLLVNDFLKDVEIIISDTGVGIPKEDIPKLFEKFSKVNRPGAQAPGAGLGLAAAKKIIDLHNGLIRVKSEVNKGTTFIVRLPKKV